MLVLVNWMVYFQYSHEWIHWKYIWLKFSVFGVDHCDVPIVQALNRLLSRYSIGFKQLLFVHSRQIPFHYTDNSFISLLRFIALKTFSSKMKHSPFFFGLLVSVLITVFPFISWMKKFQPIWNYQVQNKEFEKLRVNTSYNIVQYGPNSKWSSTQKSMSD